MAQAVLYVNGERLRQRGLTAPKRPDLRGWTKELYKTFKTDLEPLGIMRLEVLDSAASLEELRLSCKGEIGIVVDRLAAWT